jgi:hypothetical protein
MAEITYFVVQEFRREHGGWIPREPRQVPDRGIAARTIDRLRRANEPGLAFARTGDTLTGEFSDPEVIASFNVPPGFMGEGVDG